MSANSKSFAQLMIEQEERDIENAINTLNRLAEKQGQSAINGREEFAAAEFPKIDQKAVIMEYLEDAYSGAKMMDDVDTMRRLSRAILAFNYDGPNAHPTWEEMQEVYMYGKD